MHSPHCPCGRTWRTWPTYWDRTSRRDLPGLTLFSRYKTLWYLMFFLHHSHPLLLTLLNDLKEFQLLSTDQRLPNGIVLTLRCQGHQAVDCIVSESFFILYHFAFTFWFFRWLQRVIINWIFLTLRCQWHLLVNYEVFKSTFCKSL